MAVGLGRLRIHADGARAPSQALVHTARPRRPAPVSIAGPHGRGRCPLPSSHPSPGRLPSLPKGVDVAARG